MKKKFILPAAAVSLLTSCSSANDETDLNDTMLFIICAIIVIVVVAGWIGMGSDDY